MINQPQVLILEPITGVNQCWKVADHVLPWTLHASALHMSEATIKDRNIDYCINNVAHPPMKDDAVGGGDMQLLAHSVQSPSLLSHEVNVIQ